MLSCETKVNDPIIWRFSMKTSEQTRKYWIKNFTFSLFYAVVLSTRQNSQIQDLFPVRLSPIKDKIQGFPPFYTKPEINHGQRKNINISLRKKCQYSEFFWSVFSRIWTEYGEIRSISEKKILSFPRNFDYFTDTMRYYVKEYDQK